MRNSVTGILIKSDRSALTAAMFVVFSVYEVIALRYAIGNIVVKLILVTALVLGLLSIIKRKMKEPSSGHEATLKTMPYVVARFWYLASLYTLMVVYLVNANVVTFFVIQMAALITDWFYCDARHRRAFQLSSVLLTAMYTTILILQAPLIAGGQILLSFYSSWVALMVGMHYSR